MSEELDINGVRFEDESALDKQLLSAIVNAPDGEIKEASVAGSKTIRRKIREKAFNTRILPRNKATEDMLHPSLDSELPMIIETMEPDSPGAKSVSFYDAADLALFREDKFAVYFNVITTPEFTKHIDELRTVQSPLREIIVNNALNSIDNEEDRDFIATIDRIVGTVDTADGAAGVIQYTGETNAISRAAYVDNLSHLEDRDLNNGTFLMNRKTAKAFLGFSRDAIGGDLAERLFKGGLKELDGGMVMGIPHTFTIKKDLVPDNIVYQFAEPEFLGRSYQLDDVTMYVSKKEDILRFKAKEKLGMTIANVAATHKVEFEYSA